MEKIKSYNNDLLRLKNRGQVFQQLVTNDGVYRMELVETCGLTKMAISNIVNEFLEKDLVVETVKNEEKRLGRKSILLRLSPGAPKIIGLLIHRQFVSVALCDCKLNVIRSNTIRFVECNQETLMEKIYILIDEMIGKDEILGIGVGSIGPISTEKGMILNPPEFYGVKDIPIVQMLKERYKVPIHLDYHYNCAARAEKYFGLGKGYKNFILLGITEGIGISIVVDGKILTRMIGVSSEFGHITVDHNGKECFCGRRGCLGSYMDFSDEEHVWTSVKMLCAALAGICDLLMPQAIIIRDEQCCLKDEHLNWIKRELNQKIIAQNYQTIEVYKSYRSHELEAANCAANILGRIFSGELEI